MADVPILTGQDIVDTALTVVDGEALHYREWFNRLHRAGYAVAGKDPLAVMCSALHRHPLVKRVGDGIYQRDETAMSLLHAQVLGLRDEIVEHIHDPEKRDPLITELRKTERIVAGFDERQTTSRYHGGQIASPTADGRIGTDPVRAQQREGPATAGPPARR